MSKWFAWRFLEGNFQLAISEMKMSFPKIFIFSRDIQTDKIIIGNKCSGENDNDNDQLDYSNCIILLISFFVLSGLNNVTNIKVINCQSSNQLTESNNLFFNKTIKTSPEAVFIHYKEPRNVSHRLLTSFVRWVPLKTLKICIIFWCTFL